MKLYHLSRNINIIEKFEPKVPKYYDADELLIKRISLSDSIEGCIGATLKSWFEETDIKKNFKRVDSTIKKSNIKGEKKKLERFYPFSEGRLYEFEVEDDSKFLVYPNDVYEKYHVFDAKSNGEYWILKESIKPLNSKIIELNSMKCIMEDVNFHGRRMEHIHISNLKYREIKDMQAYIIRMKEYYNHKNFVVDTEAKIKKLYCRILVREGESGVNDAAKFLFEEGIKILKEKGE